MGSLLLLFTTLAFGSRRIRKFGCLFRSQDLLQTFDGLCGKGLLSLLNGLHLFLLLVSQLQSFVHRFLCFCGSLSGSPGGLLSVALGRFLGFCQNLCIYFYSDFTLHL